MTGPLKNVEEAAAWLGIPKKTLQNMVVAGEVPHSRIGRHVRFSDEHLAEIVAAGERRPIEPASHLRIAEIRGGAATGPRPPAGPASPKPAPKPKTRSARVA